MVKILEHKNNKVITYELLTNLFSYGAKLFNYIF